jgi:hypothetical protein
MPPIMRIQDDLFPSNRGQKETPDSDPFQPSGSEVQDPGGRRRMRDLVALIEQLSWRTYLKNKSQQNR